jgi:hypothetical protein
VWYSHWAGIGRLDAYRIGKWKDRHTLLPKEKLDFFPKFDIDHPKFRDVNAVISDEDYFVFYDDTEYEIYPGSSGNMGEEKNKHYIGIVRAVNIFYDSDSHRGAIVIEYLDGCYPTWDSDLYQTPLPFFGVYYRMFDSDTIQMANAINLANKYAGKKYYTETKTLEDAILKNKLSNEVEFVAWGIVIPQDREP